MGKSFLLLLLTHSCNNDIDLPLRRTIFGLMWIIIQKTPKLFHISFPALLTTRFELFLLFLWPLGRLHLAVLLTLMASFGLLGLISSFPLVVLLKSTKILDTIKAIGKSYTFSLFNSIYAHGCKPVIEIYNISFSNIFLMSNK